VLRGMDAAPDTGLALESKDRTALLFSGSEGRDGGFYRKAETEIHWQVEREQIRCSYDVAAEAAVPGAGPAGASAAASVGPLSTMTSTAATAAVTRPAMMLAPASIRKSSATLAGLPGAGAEDFVTSICYLSCI
jgi:hypothetical protein